MKKYLFLALLITSVCSSCKKSPASESQTQPVNPTPSAFYSGYVPSVKFLGALPSRSGQLDSLGYAEDLDFSLLMPFARVQATSHIIKGLPEPGHQGESDIIRNPVNSCAGWVVGYGLMSYIYTKIRGSFTGSPSYVWNQLNGGKDIAVTLPDALQIVKTQGCSNTLFMSPFAAIDQLPSEQAKDNAKHQTIAEYYPLRTMDINKIKSYLSLDVPMPIGINVDEGFMNVLSTSYDLENGQYIYKRSSGAYVGGHFLLLVGYDDAIGAFKLMNSWGPKWANKGFVWVSYETFKNLVDNVGGLLNGGFRYEMFLVIPQVVLTSGTTAITSTTATTEGTVINTAGMQVTSRGIVYSKTTRIPKVPYQEYTTNGSGLGNFKGQLTGLIPQTKYYVRAYALRSNGTYHYGEIDSFTTEISNLNVIISRTGKIITATASGGTPPYQYSFNNGAYSSSPIFTLIYNGGFSVTVKDALGTTASDYNGIDDIVVTNITCQSFDLLTNPNRRGLLTVSWTSSLGLKPGYPGPINMFQGSTAIWWWFTSSNNPYYRPNNCSISTGVQVESVSSISGDDFNRTARFILANTASTLHPINMSFRLRLGYNGTGWAGCTPTVPEWTDQIYTISW
jgi:hypothetical protein